MAEEFTNTKKEYYSDLYSDYIERSSNNAIDCGSQDKIYIKQSKIHGIGVFAKCDIQENDILTIYPAHCITIIESINPPKEFKLRCNRNIIENEKDYSIKYSNNIFITGNKLIKNDENLIGHLCNDGYKHNCIINSKKNRNQYNKQAKKFNNAKFSLLDISPIMGVISTKKIKKDEEILVSYGFEYWLRKNNEIK
jgi:hypothetical protein